MGIAPMSKIDDPKSSTSLVYFILAEARYENYVVGNKQNPHIPFSELVRSLRPKNRRKLFSCLTPRSAYEKSAVRWLRA